MAKAKPAGSKVRLQGPSSQVSCQDSEGVVSAPPCPVYAGG